MSTSTSNLARLLVPSTLSRSIERNQNAFLPTGYSTASGACGARLPPGRKDPLLNPLLGGFQRRNKHRAGVML
jgi:hypothetical protein